MTGHAFLAPSAAHVWRYCSGMPRLVAGLPPQEDSPKALEGTAAHWGAREMLYARPIAVGQVADNGVTIDEEMIQGIETYVDAIMTDLQRDPMQMVYCEQPILIATIHEQNWGTPDFWSYRPGLLRVYDFKYGHDFVEVFENWQLTDYTAGILEFLKINGLQDQQTVVEFVICQPRSFHSDGPVRRWRTRASDLRAAFNQLRYAAQLATDLTAKVTTGAQCEYCDAQRACQALQGDAMRYLDFSAEAVPFALNPVQTGHELREIQRGIEILKARERGLLEQTEQFITQGQSVPFYHMGAGRGSTVWTKSAAEVIAYGQLALGVNLAKPASVITPTQAKELHIDPALVDAISRHQPGTRKVIPINPISVRKAFTQ